MSALPAESGAYDEQPAGAPVLADAPSAPAAASVRVRRPGLHVVPAVRRSTAPLAPFVAVVAGLLLLGLGALLGLNTVLAQDAFRIHDLEQANTRLGEQEQALERRLSVLQSPAALEARARDLGMVPSSSPLFLRLPDGEVLGAAPEGPAGSADPDALAAMEAAAAETGAGETPGGQAAADAAATAGSAAAPEEGGSDEPAAPEDGEQSGRVAETTEASGEAAETTEEPGEAEEDTP